MEDAKNQGHPGVYSEPLSQTRAKSSSMSVYLLGLFVEFTAQLWFEQWVAHSPASRDITLYLMQMFSEGRDFTSCL